MRKKLWVFLNTDFPPAAWETYRGEMISSECISDKSFLPLSFWAVSYFRDHKDNLLNAKNEEMLELIRETYYPSQVSRLLGLYFFENETSAKKGICWGFNKKYLTEADLEYNSTTDITKVDAKWITKNITKKHNDNDWMKRYWSGQPFDNDPDWELIARGKAKILDINVKNKAFLTIKKLYPYSLDLLEISKISAKLGYELGHSVPFIGGTQARHKIQFIMDVREINNKKFLKDFYNYVNSHSSSCKRLYESLIKTKCRTPDFTKFSFIF
ncbi:MAG: hypothetical protein WC744_03020 [Patescibacteria group bacterium]|jgi:hypothetical protein